MKKIFGAQICDRGAKKGPKLGFLLFFQVWFISFPRNSIQLKPAAMHNI